jgi:hypothetical protein
MEGLKDDKEEEINPPSPEKFFSNFSPIFEYVASLDPQRKDQKKFFKNSNRK